MSSLPAARPQTQAFTTRLSLSLFPNPVAADRGAESQSRLGVGWRKPQARVQSCLTLARTGQGGGGGVEGERTSMCKGPEACWNPGQYSAGDTVVWPQCRGSVWRDPR